MKPKPDQLGQSVFSGEFASPLWSTPRRATVGLEMQNWSERTMAAIFAVSLLAVAAGIAARCWPGVVYVTRDGQPFELVEPQLLELEFDEQGRPIGTLNARPCPADWVPGHEYPQFLQLQTTRAGRNCIKRTAPQLTESTADCCQSTSTGQTPRPATRLEDRP